MPSSVDSVVKLLTGAPVFLSGALVATLVTVIVGGVRARCERETAWLQEQLRSLYGPLAFFTNQNRQLLDLAGRVQDVHSGVFSGNWSQDEATQEALERKSTATLDLGNRYVKQVGGNNARIMEILEKNWHLADSPDCEVFSQFQVHHIRFLTEVEQQGRDGLPFRVIMDLGPIFFMPPGMNERVDSALSEKQMRLNKFRFSWWRRSVTRTYRAAHVCARCFGSLIFRRSLR